MCGRPSICSQKKDLNGQRMREEEERHDLLIAAVAAAREFAQSLAERSWSELRAR